MAGLTKTGNFSEKISPYLKRKMEEVLSAYGENSYEYKAFYLQYVQQDLESVPAMEANERHWQADIQIQGEGASHHGIERLYNRTVVLEPTMVCAAHCRYCLRANYSTFTLKDADIENIAKYIGQEKYRQSVKEALITGGDPLVVPKRLMFFVESLIKYAPNIEIMRIATRLPLHDPERINNNVLEIFKRYGKSVRFELATQINHRAELFPEVVEKYQEIQSLGVRVYSQNVLLKGVNDNVEVLVDLYQKLRDLDFEAHYLFHCVPMKGMHHFRTTYAKGLELAKQLTNSGRISGRIKPMYAAMTDIGKIIAYHGTVLQKNEATNRVLLQSNYNFEDRIKWNPDYKLPDNAVVDDKGLLQVWYLDGNDD